MQTQPVIELKNIQTAAFASEETHCYEASLYVDGVKWGTVSNEGHGGPDLFYGFGGKTYEDIKALDERIKATFPKVDVSHFYGDGEKHEMDQSLEVLCGELVNDHLMARTLKRDLSKKVLFTKPGEAGIFQVSMTQKGRKYTADEVFDAMARRHPGIKALHQMPFDEALKVYRAGV